MQRNLETDMPKNQKPETRTVNREKMDGVKTGNGERRREESEEECKKEDLNQQHSNYES